MTLRDCFTSPFEYLQVLCPNDQKLEWWWCPEGSWIIWASPLVIIGLGFYEKGSHLSHSLKIPVLPPCNKKITEFQLPHPRRRLLVFFSIIPKSEGRGGRRGGGEGRRKVVVGEGRGENFLSFSSMLRFVPRCNFFCERICYKLNQHLYVIRIRLMSFPILISSYF